MLKSLKTTNFRNLFDQEISFSPRTTILVGDNGQGKTNILEASYLLSYGKVFRGEKLSAISWGKESAVVEGNTDRDNLKVILDREGENQILINDKTKPVQE